jgi:hypothetical protein
MNFAAARRIAIVSLLGAAAAGLLGCSSGGGGAVSDAAAGLDAVYEVAVSLPDGCPPATGNAIGVGLPCTTGGNECKSKNLQCSCDPFLGAQISGIPCLCTNVGLTSTAVPDGGTTCDNIPASFCGAGAKCCPYLGAGYYCVPDICLAGDLCPDVSGGP